MKKAFNEDIDESWIDWAVGMIEADFESDNLYILAGEIRPYNQFELQALTNKVLEDLNLNFSDKSKVIRDYVYFLVTKAVDNPSTYSKTLRELRDICIGLDLDKEYMDFYLLYYAKNDLADSENQWFWEGADKQNIDTIIKGEFEKFIDKFDRSEVKTTA